MQTAQQALNQLLGLKIGAFIESPCQGPPIRMYGPAEPGEPIEWRPYVVTQSRFTAWSTGLSLAWRRSAARRSRVGTGSMP